MNTQPRHPKCRALPVELHPDIQFLPLYHGREENQRFFCLWSFMWSKPILYRFQQPGKVPQTQASQGFAAFRLTLSRIPPRHSQITCATNCATPGYSIFLHDTMQRRKKQVFRVCGRRCGQARFCGSFSTEEFPPQATVPRSSGISHSGEWIGRLSSQSKRATNCATPGYGIVLSVVFHVVLAVF